MKAEKGKRGTGDITKYFRQSADTNKTRPTEQALQLTQSKSGQQKECDQAEIT